VPAKFAARGLANSFHSPFDDSCRARRLPHRRCETVEVVLVLIAEHDAGAGDAALDVQQFLVGLGQKLRQSATIVVSVVMSASAIVSGS
jgi:hypothetical protein